MCQTSKMGDVSKISKVNKIVKMGGLNSDDKILDR
jgi:hypothetical protein